LSLYPLKREGVKLPPKETEENLTGKEIVDKIRSFYRRLEKSHREQVVDFAEAEFLELLCDYPHSMCKRDMSDTLKLLIALVYFGSKPEYREDMSEDPWQGYTYDDLSLMFDRSKASIHQAIREKEVEAKHLLEELNFEGKLKN